MKEKGGRNNEQEKGTRREKEGRRKDKGRRKNNKEEGRKKRKVGRRKK